MSASLVGSEMCIRDRSAARAPCRASGARICFTGAGGSDLRRFRAADRACLLYTSDAADDM
eukprot:8656631-Alexandrium_andersonii.AAC.1